MPATQHLRLTGFQFAELFSVDGLRRLDQAFFEHLATQTHDCHERLAAYRAEGVPDTVATSELLIEAACHLESFIAHLFGIEDEVQALRQANLAHADVLAFKAAFVQRRARRGRAQASASFVELDAWLAAKLRDRPGASTDREAAVAAFAAHLLTDETAHRDSIERLVDWCRAALSDANGQQAVANWTSFRLPRRVDHARLVAFEKVDVDGGARLQAHPENLRRRDGFGLTDLRMDLRAVQGEVHYCIYCHGHAGDFCSKGFPARKGAPARGLKVDPLGVELTGCPLEEKISEMHQLERDGRTLAALAVAMADNPMIPATGHRICNDCMKACIYQKQDPVNIPQIETRVLTDVLALPWGVEIYDLLTRWNPLRRRQFLPQPYNGRKVLIAGMGPAGFTMAHHLTQQGCTVVGIDGLKIEPLPSELLSEPVKDWSALAEPLDSRVLLGFGGVAEYGITVRWDKSFLKLIYLSLARRALFQVFGGVRLGGTLTIEDAAQLGFDHVCVATGAGLPRVIPIGNSLACGMRQASDFLMALQLTGAAKDDSLANLQVRLPAAVIGGGLTAIDTATEVQAHYVRQVEKVLHRYERLMAEGRAQAWTATLTDGDRATLEEFLAHGRAVRAERERSAQARETPDFLPLVRRWGGVTLVYRKGMNASPAYVRNHEEIIKALEEGIYYAEGLEPLRVDLDPHGHVRALVCRRMEWAEGRWLATAREETLATASIFVAAGASPNTIYEHEHPGTFELDDVHFLPHVDHQGALQPVQVASHAKADEFGPFTSYQRDGRKVSFIGDTHPVFHGSVVKAIASAQRSYPQIMAALAEQPCSAPATDNEREAFQQRMTSLLEARVTRVEQVTPGVLEVWVRAPMAARRFQPGQFFRLQTYESSSPLVEGTRLQVPVLTVSGTGVRDDAVRLLVLQWGGAPRLVARLQVGAAVVLMGPTGAAIDIPRHKTVLIVAGQWGAAVMLDIGPALRRAGNRVLYVAAFGSADELHHRDELESSADQIIWCTASGPIIRTRRGQDSSVSTGDVIELLERYTPGEGGIGLDQVDRVVVMGSTGLLSGFQEALNGSLRARFKAGVEAIGTVGSPMQCMLKGVCAQCLQWQIDPQTGHRTRAVFSCAHQDQPLAWIDVENLAARQGQNRLLDSLTAEWLDWILEKAHAR